MWFNDLDEKMEFSKGVICPAESCAAGQKVVSFDNMCSIIKPKITSVSPVPGSLRKDSGFRSKWRRANPRCEK